jgi:DNA-directed RNA polymerase specialized sigma24 family protein
MGSPSPLDRCWMLNDSPGTLPLTPAVRAAVEWYWSDLQCAATSVLKDESLAAEIMEDAIARAVAYLADHPPKDQDDVNAVLSRFCRREVGRRRKRHSRLVFIDLSAAQLSSSDTPFSIADAVVDVERILRDAPPEVRQAMMLRYGSSESWSEVAAVTGSGSAAIRMRCKRFMDRIRRKFGIEGAPQ